MATLEAYIKSYFGLPDSSLEAMTSYFKAETIEKGAFFLRADAYCDRLSFVESGLLRMYRWHEDREVTNWISGPGFFVTDLRSFIFREPSRWQIQALTDARIFSIRQQDYEALGSTVPDWNKLEKCFLAACFSMLEDRMFAQLSLSAEERYERLVMLQPDLVLQVPLQYLASMLGMTPETLSRVRRKM